MSAIRRTMLCAFAGGCLTNAVLFGVWRFAEGTSHSSEPHPQSNHVVELAQATAAPPSVAQPSEPIAVSAGDRGYDSTTRALPPPSVADLDSAAPTPAGSAVSDVLTRLEAAYRERVVASAPAQASLVQERAAAVAPPDTAVATAEAIPSVPAPPLPAVIPATLAVAAAPQVAAPVAAAPVAVTPALPEPQPAAAPAVALQDAPPPTVVQYGDVNQNTYITNVREGDVYQIQMQQIAVLQYMQLLGMSAAWLLPRATQTEAGVSAALSLAASPTRTIPGVSTSLR